MGGGGLLEGFSACVSLWVEIAVVVCVCMRDCAVVV